MSSVGAHRLRGRRACTRPRTRTGARTPAARPRRAGRSSTPRQPAGSAGGEAPFVRRPSSSRNRSSKRSVSCGTGITRGRAPRRARWRAAGRRGAAGQLLDRRASARSWRRRWMPCARRRGPSASSACHRGHRPDGLAPHPERLPTRRKDAEARTDPEQALGDAGGLTHQVLAVVEEQQGAPAVDVVGDAVEASGRLRGRVRPPERADDDVDDRVGVTEGGQLHEEHILLVLASPADLHGQASLAGSAGADDRQEPPRWDERTELREISGTTDERAQRRGEVRAAPRWRPRRRAGLQGRVLAQDRAPSVRGDRDRGRARAPRRARRGPPGRREVPRPADPIDRGQA